MKGAIRDFLGYGANPPKVEWPGLARLALNIAFAYEEGSELGAVDGDPEREMQAEQVFPVKSTERELANEDTFEYGSRVGVWRLMRILDKYDATCSVFVAGLALERNPAAVEAFNRRGYDMVGHGYRWISHYGMTEDQERDHIRRGRESIERITGQRVIGWYVRSPVTAATRRILAEEGFVYDSHCYDDDLPYFEQIGDKRILAMPYTLDNNDIRFYKGQLFVANDYFEYLRDAFDTLYEEGATHPKMMSVTLHCRVSGKPSRAQAIDRFLAYVRRFSDVWIARRNDIANFWLEKYG